MSSASLPSSTLTNDGDLGSEILVASWTLTCVSALFLFTRVFAKLWTHRGLWVDDYILILAWLAVLAPAIMSTVAVEEGFGKHIYNVSPEKVSPLLILINSIVTVLILASALSKTSFVLTILRLVTGWMRWSAWFVLVTTNIFFGVNILLVWLIFNPNPPASGPTQLPSPGFDYSGLSSIDHFPAYSAAMDFALVGMAWIVVSRLQMRKRREKFGVGLAMSMGIIAGATSIVKAVIFPTLSNGDVTFTSASLHIWSMVEPSITIIATSIPLLRVIFTHVRHLATQSGSAHYGSGNADYRRSIAASANRRRKGSGSISTVTVSNSGGSNRTPYVDSSKDSDEIVMLESLHEVPLVEMEPRQTPEVEDVEEGANPTGRSFYLV
ncbi:hypothetical protein N0V93_004196 [Gnomoniopsis smithogilvyi]|uniref:Rhodopsin domain-containing protein n=1 Tax=Gnomoniopsis smithogilvyi TaxID=1191159 RepID=A0A9W8YS70_9PEZI|nr:hypothetical protein N0V93_004196 [Gnomoniopsis smithogilvyi]